MIRQKWHIKIGIFIKLDFSKNIITLVDSDADINCIHEGLIPSEYYEKSLQRVVGANKQALKVEYKVSNVHVCNKNICYKISLLLVKDMNKEMILGTPFLSLLYPLTVDKEGIKTIYENQEICFYFLNAPKIKELNFVDNQVNLIQKKKQQIKFLGKEIHHKRIEENILNKDIQIKVEKIKKQIEQDLCSSIPNAFWNRKKHKVSLPYVEGFDETQIPTKARPIQMNTHLLEYCKEEIKDLLNKNLIRKNQSPWNCAAFYVQKPLEIERGAPRLVIN